MAYANAVTMEESSGNDFLTVQARGMVSTQEVW